MYWLVVGIILVGVGVFLHRATKKARADLDSVLRYQPNTGSAIVLAFGFTVLGSIFVIAGLIDLLA